MRSEGSINEGESLGLTSEGSKGSGEVLVRGGKYSRVKGSRASEVDTEGEAEGADISKAKESKKEQ